MTNVTLNPDQARFAQDCVASGRYASVADVVTDALHRLQRFEEERAELLASVLEAKAEGERDGFATLDEVEAEMRRVIQEAVRSPA